MAGRSQCICSAKEAHRGAKHPLQATGVRNGWSFEATGLVTGLNLEMQGLVLPARKLKWKMPGKYLFAVAAVVWRLAGCSQPASAPAPGQRRGVAAPPVIREWEAPAADVILHARMAGDPKARNVLIALHGGPGCSSDYMLGLEQLASDTFAVVTYDQRGTGQSTEPSQGYAMAGYTSDLEAVRQAVGADRVHLLGHSWGGIVALRYAVAHPDRVKSIILMGSGVPDKRVIQEAQERLAERIAALQAQGVIPQAITGPADVLPAYLSDPNFAMPAELKHMFYRQDVQNMTWSALADTDLAADVDQLGQPVLVLYGEDDPFGRPMAEATAAALAAARVELVLLERCGHYWHECPDQFYPRVRAFLALHAG